MVLEKGAQYQISQKNTISHFNKAQVLTIIYSNENIVQFTLGEGKGHGSMPVQQFDYLLKKKELIPIKNKRALLNTEEEEEQIS